MEEYLQVGILVKPHGVRGAVKVLPTTDEQRRFKKGQEFLLQGKKESLTVKVESAQYFKQFAILKLEGFDSPEAIDLYRGCSLLTDRAHAARLKKDEYFIADLIGLPVYDDEEGTLIGTVKDVLSTGANEVFIIEAEGGILDGKEIAPGTELLFPSIKECIKEVDAGGGRIIAHIMPGLL